MGILGKFGKVYWISEFSMGGGRVNNWLRLSEPQSLRTIHSVLYMVRHTESGGALKSEASPGHIQILLHQSCPTCNLVAGCIAGITE